MHFHIFTIDQNVKIHRFKQQSAVDGHGAQSPPTANSLFCSVLCQQQLQLSVCAEREFFVEKRNMIWLPGFLHGPCVNMCAKCVFVSISQTSMRSVFVCLASIFVCVCTKASQSWSRELLFCIVPNKPSNTTEDFQGGSVEHLCL